jgi:hypothetical protein
MQGDERKPMIEQQGGTRGTAKGKNRLKHAQENMNLKEA